MQFQTKHIKFYACNKCACNFNHLNTVSWWIKFKIYSTHVQFSCVIGMHGKIQDQLCCYHHGYCGYVLIRWKNELVWHGPPHNVTWTLSQCDMDPLTRTVTKTTPSQCPVSFLLSLVASHCSSEPSHCYASTVRLHQVRDVLPHRGAVPDVSMPGRLRNKLCRHQGAAQALPWGQCCT